MERGAEHAQGQIEKLYNQSGRIEHMNSLVQFELVVRRVDPQGL